MKMLIMTGYRSNRIERLSVYMYVIFFMCVFLFPSCKKESSVHVTAVPKLSVSDTSVLLSNANAGQTAVTFSWTAAAVKGINGSLTYFLQWDVKGNNFANEADIKIGRDTLTKAFTDSALNTLLTTLPPGTSSQIEVRIVYATSDGSVAPFYSNMVSLSVTPYANSVPPPYSQLWIVGDATPNGWDITNPTPMLQSGSDLYIFSLTVNLTAGEFKIATAEDFNAPFYRPIINHPPLTDTAVQLNATTPDNKWQITKPGKYSITLNLHDLSVHIVDLDSALSAPPYSQLWIVGDATPDGWNINAPNPMVQDVANPNIFTYTGPLTVGEFKMPVAIGSWSTLFYRPVTNHPDTSDHRVVLMDSNSGDYKWYISNAGNYIISLDLSHLTISILKQ